MKKIYLCFFVLGLGIIGLIFFSGIFNSNNIISESSEEENDKYDNPEAAAIFQFERTKNPTTGIIPDGAYMEALNATMLLKQNTANRIEALNWIERGPNSDVVGPSNGNTRANNGITAGRVDAIMVDAADATGKTVFAGGRGGGLWKTLDITVSPANWILVNDYLLNQSIAAICQDPTNLNVMYMATGESFGESGALRGNGVFKSIDHGVTWVQLSSTTAYTSCTRILCDFEGNVYLGTRGSGLLRSAKASGGATWTNITPTGLTANIADLDITSTTAAARLHVTTGIFGASAYRYTDLPSTVTSSTGWNAPTTPFPALNQRCEIGVSGNTLYACPANASYQVPAIYKSTDGGDNWVSTGGQPATNWASGQGWYALTVIINPSNPNECIVGGLDQHKTTNGGASWTKISSWVGTTGQYVHADQHGALWYDVGNKIIFACDGGIHFSSDGGITSRDRNIGLRLKQFYSVAMHPTNVNYFLAGAQDNGTHQLNNAGLGASVEVTGGDGAYVDIDNDEPQFQFGAYVYNQYRRSTNGGTSWGSVNFSGTVGRFINPFDYDDVGNRMYCSYAAGQYLRWDNPQTGNTTAIVDIPSFSTGQVSSITVSPYTPNTVYFGTTLGRLVKVTDAAGVTPVDINMTPAGMSGYVNSITVGQTDLNLVATITSYGVTNIWVTNDGGLTWSGVDGNLPNIPVYSAIFNPDDNSKLIIGTETGVWSTDLINGASTNWVADNTFPTVRTTMLRYRNLDRTIAASTYGRGVWSCVLAPVACLPISITQNPTNVTTCNNTSVSFTAAAAGSASIAYQWQVSTAGGAYTNIVSATSATYSFVATTPQNGNKYRCVATGTCGTPSTLTTTFATLTITAPPTILNQPTSSVVCAGSNTSFAVNAIGVTGYQWQQSVDGGVTFGNVPNTAPYSGNLTATLSISNTTAGLSGTQYRILLSNGTCSTTSNAVTLTVNNAPLISTIGQPANTSICTGNIASFNVIATGSTLTYQWYNSSTGLPGSFSPISGATNATYSTALVTSTTPTYYQVVVGGPSCAGSVTSNTAQLTINAAPTLISSTNNQIVCIPNTATFSCNATGTGLTYQWQTASSPTGTFSNVTSGIGANTPIYTTPATTTSMNGSVYRVIVTGTCSPAITSTNALLTVNTPVTITKQPQMKSGCANDNYDFSVVATSIGNALTYQWQSSPTGLAGTYTNIAGANVSNLTINNAPLSLNGYFYRVYITTPCGANLSTDTSVSAKLLLSSKPIILLTAPSVSSTNPTLNSFLLASVNPSGNYIYSWKREGIVIPNLSIDRTLISVDDNANYQVSLIDLITGCVSLSNIYKTTAGTSDNLIVDKLFIYPNPVVTTMQVRYNNSSSSSRAMSIVIYDEKGSRVFAKAFPIVGTFGRMEIDMTKHAKGAYFVYILDANGKKLATSKVIKG
jgi:Ig-like domain CHU_C associated/Secretion system C-terminal sorting domain